jgi:hypothetical protein
MSKWQGLLSDRLLQTLALDALLTRYTLLGIRIAPDLTESCEKAKGVSGSPSLLNGMELKDTILFLLLQFISFIRRL